jgi:hypothetical protein
VPPIAIHKNDELSAIPDYPLAIPGHREVLLAKQPGLPEAMSDSIQRLLDGRHIKVEV